MIRPSLRKGEGGPAGGATPSGAAPGSEASAERAALREPEVVCRACGHTIAPVDAAISVAGSHLHTFMNPAGFVFEIVCYREAPGTRGVGSPSAEWSWFPHHLWQVALCAACNSHVGWGFRSEGDSFFGLIRDRIAESEGG